ncbi:MAG TPA: hypothetical protein VMH32_12730 [Burkholderiales bacterium]|nr:hypothetical protein [Burkholderiales bacterium]
MKLALVLTVAAALVPCVAGQASAQDADRVKQIDRVCVGRMLIVQAMDLVRQSGKTEREYRDENPFDPLWKPAMKEEVSAVITYVWSHSHEQNLEFSGAVMDACYSQNSES